MNRFPSFRRSLSLYLVAAVLIAGAVPALRAVDTSTDRDQRWQHIKALQQELAGDPPKGQNEIEYFAPVKAQLHREAADFAAQGFAASPQDDPRRWEALLLQMKTDVFPTPAAERKLMFQDHERIVASIQAAPDAPADIKQNALRTVLFQHLDHLDLITTPAEATALEQRLIAYLKQYPDDKKASSMQVRRADLLAKSDPSKVRPLLEELAASNDPKVAAAARGRLAQQALAATPLDWKFTALDGRVVDFQELRGRVILVDFWASWCPDCLRALPEVLATYHKYHEQGLEIVGVSVDSDEEALRTFVKKHAMPWPEQFDGKAWDTDLATRYGVKGIPEMWLVGRDGRVTATGVQADELDEKVASLLGK